jgi:hypothetical protein
MVITLDAKEWLGDTAPTLAQRKGQEMRAAAFESYGIRVNQTRVVSERHIQLACDLTDAATPQSVMQFCEASAVKSVRLQASDAYCYLRKEDPNIVALVVKHFNEFNFGELTVDEAFDKMQSAVMRMLRVQTPQSQERTWLDRNVDLAAAKQQELENEVYMEWKAADDQREEREREDRIRAHNGDFFN